MDVTEKVKKAKVKLLLNHPFYASLVMRMHIAEDLTCKTAQTDGESIFYSPIFFDTLTIEEVAGVLAHEVPHITLLHHLRIEARSLDQWNVACDFAINPIVIGSGLPLPEGVLLDAQFADKTAEHIYALLPPPPPGQPPPTGIGEVVPPPPTANPKEQELRVQNAVRQASLDAKLKNKMPPQLERVVQQVLKPKIDWQAALAVILSEIVHDDYSWTKPSRRYLFRKLYLPSMESLTHGPLIFIVDTSISIDQKMINQFAGEVQAIANFYEIPLQVIYVDDEVRFIQDIDPDEPVELHPQGGGYTDFRPGFDYIEQQELQPRAVIYLTDGECDSLPDPPDYLVIWAKFGHCDFHPPFGEVIEVVA